MPKFQNGEIAILCNLINESERFNGEEVLIVRYTGLEEWKYQGGETVLLETYVTSAHFHKGYIKNCDPCLKKKPPPEEEINWVEKLNLEITNKEPA